MVIDYSFFLIKDLPKNQPVSLLEILPNKGIQYVRSSGSFSKILKMDSRISTSLIKLPSGVKKIFSTYSLGSVGSVALPENKKCLNNSAGFYKKFGKKSQVRGVAMNPVDHPHGGRAKSVKYQRTP
jgi:large subunit ribosomal protein L2